MRLTIRNRSVHMAAGATVVFLGAVAMLPVDTMIEVINWITIFASVSLVSIYAPLWWPALRGHLDGAYRLGLGVGLLALSIAAGRIWAGIWRVADYPTWMREHPIVAVWPFVGLLGCALLITVPSNVDKSVQRRSWILLLVSIALGALAAGIVIGVRWKEVIVAAVV